MFAVSIETNGSQLGVPKRIVVGGPRADLENLKKEALFVNLFTRKFLELV